MKPKMLVIVFCLTTSLIGNTLSYAEDQLICCGRDEVFILQIQQDSSVASKPVWTWKAEDSPEIPETARKSFATTDECKPVGDSILITSSSGGVALIRRSDKSCQFYTLAKNAHSACLLPNKRVAVASSFGGDELLIYNLEKPQDGPSQPVTKIPLKGAHGALWDKKMNRLWALGSDELLLIDIREQIKKLNLILSDGSNSPLRADMISLNRETRPSCSSQSTLTSTALTKKRASSRRIRS